MAAKGSTSNASDELFDFSCSPCNKKGKNKEALKYCVDCQEYLCGPCEDSHNSFSVLAGHSLVGRSKFGGLSGSDSKDLPSVPTERCQLHSLKLVDMYCADHDTVGCHVCFTINHKSCQDIHYIPEYVQNNNQMDKVKMIKGKLEQAMSEMDLVLMKKQEAIEDNKKMKATFLEEILNFRKEINEVLDRLELASVADLDRKFERLNEDFQTHLNMLQDAIERLTTRKTELESSQRNPSQQFVNVKLSERILADIEKDESMMLMNQGKCFSFERNTDALHFLENLEKLVNFPFQKQGLYKVSSRNTHNVKMKEENNECDIWSSCVLHSGDILLADFNNANIKVVDNVTYKIKNHLNLTGAPSSVCNISNVEAAVSFWDANIVQFISTKNQLTKTRSLQFDHKCRGIDVFNGQLVISNNSDKIYMYTMNGEGLKNIERDKTGQQIFSWVREIYVSDNNNVIHVTDGNKGVMTISIDGNVIAKYADQKLKSPWGVCTDDRGNVFVSDKSSKNVVQLGPDGKLLGEIVSKGHGLKKPLAVCFDKKQCKLIVADGKELHVFELQ